MKTDGNSIKLTIFPKITGPTNLGDAKLNIGLRLARSVSPYRHGFGTIPSHIFLNALYICFCVRCTGNHAALVRLYYYSEHLAALSCENLSGVCADCTDYWALHCLRAAQVSGKPHVQMGYRSIFRLVFQREYVVRCPLVRKVWPGQLPKGKKSPLDFFWVIVSLGLLVSFASQSGLHPPTITPTNTKKHRDARAQTTHIQRQRRAHKKNKYTKSIPRNQTNNAKIQQQIQNRTKHTKIQQQIQMKNPSQNARTLNTPKNTSRGETFGSNTRRLFLARGPVLCKYNKVGITRQDDVPTSQLVPNARS